MKTIQDKDVKFLLKDPRADRQTLISLFFRYDNQRFVYSTEQTIEPYQWDAENQRVRIAAKPRSERDRHETINAQLQRHRAALKQVITALQLAGIPLTNPVIKQHLDQSLQRVRVKPASKSAPDPTPAEPFTKFIERFVAEGRAGQRLNASSQHYSRYTLNGYLGVKRLLDEYNIATGRPVDYWAFNLDFYHQFKLWLTGKKLTLNYVGCVLKNLKLMLKQAHADGLHTNTVFQHRDFKKFSEEVDTIYLSEDELTRLYDLDLTATPRLERARDLFLIGCYTGLRFSDFTQLRSENINGRILTRRTLKTSERVSIPLNSRVLAILKKYNGTPPPSITNQRINDHLKEVCKRIGLTDRVEVSRTRGGRAVSDYPEKWELVTTHTARRSFATNAYLAKVPTVS